MTDIVDMLMAIEADMKATGNYTGRYQLHSSVRAAMADVVREDFVPEELRYSAYDNNPLPIGHSQTISQPFIVALMTDLLDPKPEHRVLEVGTGSGYQAAVLSHLVKDVYSIEVLQSLATESSQRLEKLGYENVHVECKDGHEGWPENAPYHGIIVTAAAEYLPENLASQLAPGGRIVIPMGVEQQWIFVGTKQEDGTVELEKNLPVRFVPFV